MTTASESQGISRHKITAFVKYRPVDWLRHTNSLLDTDFRSAQTQSRRREYAGVCLQVHIKASASYLVNKIYFLVLLIFILSKV